MARKRRRPAKLDSRRPDGAGLAGRRDWSRDTPNLPDGGPAGPLDRYEHSLFLAAALAVLAALGFMSFFPVQSDDLFMYLAIGRRVVRNGAFPSTDPFLFSIPDYHWRITHEWAAHLIAYGAYRLGGWTVCIIGKTLILLATALVPLAVARRLGVRTAAVPLGLFLAILAGYHRFIERSSLASDFLTSVVLAVVVLDRRAPGRLRYLLPLIFLCWVNLHPGFYIGLAICGLALLWDIPRIKHRPVQVFAACVLASVLACLANPEGLNGLVYPLRPMFDPTWDAYRQHNYEWMATLSPGYRDSVHAYAFVGLLGLCGLLAVLALPARPWFEISVLALLAWLGLSAIRFVNTASFALSVLAVVLASKSALASWASRAPPVRKLGLVMKALMTLTAAGYAVKVGGWGYDTLAGPRHLGIGLDATQHPEQAAEFIERIDLQTNMFNEHSFGAYLAWRWDGRRKIYYHGFVDDLRFYARDYLGVTDSPEEFQRIVDQYRIGAFLLRPPSVPPAYAPLVFRILLTSPDWHLVYQDPVAMVFLRNIPENQAALARCTAPR